VIDYLRMQGIQHFIFSLYYKADVIQNFLVENYPTLDFKVVVEEEPLGTGGAIQLALQETDDENVLITNGDTLFKVDVNALAHLHISQKAECTLALKPMYQFDRYGVVEINDANQIISFKEKDFYENGMINGGIYILNREQFLKHNLPQKFSFEKDYLQTFYKNNNLFGLQQNGYFIDIGIPEDYQKAQDDFKREPFNLDKIDHSWTLFLDRDGVINEERVGEYVLTWNQFIFSKGVLDAFKIFSEHFHRIIIVSNQRGVGRGLMTKEALDSIHYEMKREVEVVGGKIDRILYCTEKDENCFFRKPNPGMALQAKKEFEDIDLSKSIMVGNKLSDMKFGRAAGMYTIFLASTNPETPYPHPDIDFRVASLFELSHLVNRNGHHR
ncbi:MAG TPA: HAD-IIIA family hydrolase, partial [Flavisolibacter sp.]|nr:HAD-IIIA family hydrolase [Flavisolibacter sp.]